MATLVEGSKPFSAGDGINIDSNKVISVLLREENNLIMVNEDRELYTDLQFAPNITSNSEFPVGVTVGKVLEADGWEQSGLILNWKTTSGDYARWIYGADGEIYFDGGTGEWKQVYYSSEVDDLFTALRNELHTVTFSGDYNDLENKPVIISATEPANRVEGMLWYDTTNDALKNHNGTGWIIMATKPYVDSKVSDIAYGNSWDGVTDIAPSKNTVYNKINSIDELIPSEATSSNQLADKNYVDNKVSDNAYSNSWDGVTDTAPSKNAVYDKINSIDGLIPSEATSSNQLADKNYVNDSINSVTAYYITKNAQGDAFATYAELSSATTFYSGGVARTPTRNDYCIVLSDENHSNGVTRYSYQGTQWEYQYTVNESPMTQAQLDALNSGITSTKVGQYDTAVSTIGGYGNVVTHNASEFATSTQGAKADTALQPNDDISELNNDAGFVTASIIDDTAYGNGWDGDTTHAPTKNAVYDKINTMDGTISGKQDTLVSGTNIKSVNGNSLLGNGDLVLHSGTTASLTVNGWSSNTQTVTVSGVTASNYVIVSPAPANLQDYTEAKIYCSAQGSNSLTFTCDTVPSSAITVNIMILN